MADNTTRDITARTEALTVRFTPAELADMDEACKTMHIKKPQTLIRLALAAFTNKPFQIDNAPRGKPFQAD